MMAKFFDRMFLLFLVLFLLAFYKFFHFETLKINLNMIDVPIYMPTSSPVNHVFLVNDWNCSAFIHGNKTETKRGVKAKVREMPTIKDLKCVEFRKMYGYNDYLVSEEEQSFPIAYNILLHRDFIQVEYLLRTIYRPHNHYCIHIDGFSAPEYHDSVHKLSKCFDNVFIVSKTENVTYAHFSRLQADINCMKDHLNHGKTWKYLLNTPGQQFPLKTNAEIVAALKNLNNRNNIDGDNVGQYAFRYQFKFILKPQFEKPNRFRVASNDEKNRPPPYNLTIYKGSAYGVFSRQFVDYIVNNKIARDLLEWSRDVYSPDEFYWATLNYNTQLQAPGCYSVDDETNPFLAVYVAWRHEECYGMRNRGYCTFTVQDLPTLVKRPEFFANKLNIHFDALTLRCLGEWIYKKTVGLLPSGGG